MNFSTTRFIVMGTAYLLASASQAGTFDPVVSKDMMCVIVAATANRIAEVDALSATSQAEKIKTKSSSIQGHHLAKFRADETINGQFTKEEFSDGLQKGLQDEYAKFTSSIDKFFVGPKDKKVDIAVVTGRISKYIDDRYKAYNCSAE